MVKALLDVNILQHSEADEASKVKGSRLLRAVPHQPNLTGAQRASWDTSLA